MATLTSALVIPNEVSYHKTVTDAVEAVLIPSARNPELKSALEGAQPLFLKHLEHARWCNPAKARWPIKRDKAGAAFGLRARFAA